MRRQARPLQRPDTRTVKVPDDKPDSNDLRTGRLVAPFSLSVRTSGAYYLAYPPQRPKSERLMAFEEWLLTEAQAAEARAIRELDSWRMQH